MISSGGKGRRVLFVLTSPLWGLWVIVAFIWGGPQGVTDVADQIDRWARL